MYEEFFDKLAELRKRNEAFVTATVVRREVPSSGKSGDKAIVDKYGVITGWIGGGCVKGIILKESDDALRSGRSRLVKVGPSLTAEKQDGVVDYKMTCMSEGTIEVFIEPVLPSPHLIVMGKTAIAKALVKMAKAAGYKVTAVAAGTTLTTFDKVDELITQMKLEQVKISSASSIVVCTQGEQDEEALQEALKKECAYIGFVASRKKKAGVFENMQQMGIDKSKLEVIKSPAGIDITAKKPEEVAISILAEIIQVQNNRPINSEGFIEQTEISHELSAKPSYYINPVCGVPVDRNSPKYIIEYNGEKVYFCCDGCKVKFEAEPSRYMNKAH
ncbi:MAG: XdhC family protein [Chitinophagaceae bacterium]